MNRKLLVPLVLIAALVHGAAISWVYFRNGRIDAFAFNSLDCTEYYAIARNLVEHGRFSQDAAPPLTPDTWRTPGYPFFLAACMIAVGTSPVALIVIQHLIALGSVILFFCVASRRLGDGKALIAATILLLEPYHLFYSFWLLSTTFFTFALIVTWWAWERARQRANLWNCCLLGLLCGYLVLIWPGAMLIPILVVFGSLVSTAKLVDTSPNHHITTSPNRVILLIIVAASCLLPAALWVTRNRVVAGHFGLSHQSGIVLAYFKATEVELWRQNRTPDRYIETSLNPAHRELPHEVWDRIDEQLQNRLDAGNADSPLKWPNLAQGNKTEFDSFEVSSQLSSIGRDMLLESPVATLSCGVARIFENLGFPLGLAIAPPSGVATSRLKSAALGSIYFLLLFMALRGVWRARQHWADFYFPAAAIVALAITTSPQIDPRFRVPMIPFLAFLALLPARREE